ncbi:hypothetical protein [Lysinibacillus sp. 38-6]|uniref:hypothetical protein n=1 Tax=Lysinibacillus sp. 38-6 TaxID=3385991 RepID=UPI003908A594
MKYFQFILICSIVIVLLFGCNTSQRNSQQNIERFFANEDIYNTAHEKYGIYSMGVDPKEKVFVVGMDVSNLQHKKNVEQFMKQHLLAYHLKEYGIEVYVYENGNQ